MTESKHTPLPWHVGTEGPWKGAVFGGNDYRVADVEPYGHGIAEANAAYIVQCCNAYPSLVEALKVAQHALTVTHNVLATDRPDKAAFAIDCAWTTDFTNELSVIEAALRAAGEEL